MLDRVEASRRRGITSRLISRPRRGCRRGCGVVCPGLRYRVMGRVMRYGVMGLWGGAALWRYGVTVPLGGESSCVMALCLQLVGNASTVLTSPLSTGNIEVKMKEW